MENPMSFWQLIGRFKIEIPVIQRDYAQGRDNPRAIDVRKKIVKKIVDSLMESDKDVFFDFVYGRIDGEVFIPFDGQQRLTTLFLLHKYVFERCKNVRCGTDSCKCMKMLGRFTYATRQSSREFCEALVNERIVPEVSEEVAEENPLEKFIQNQAWFFPGWDKDPTISGMLVMLDEIHSQLKKCEVDYGQIAQRLTSPCDCPITFHFVDMEGLGIPDEVYVKMNARGKRLTPFESFKASLEQYFETKNGSETESKDLLGRMKKAIDVKWLDLFWEILNPTEKENKIPPDSLMLSFVNRHILNVWEVWYAQRCKTESVREKLGEDEQKLQVEYDKLNNRLKTELSAYPVSDDFVAWELYDDVINHCGLKKCIQPIFNIWDALSKQKNIIVNSCQPIWQDESRNWNPFLGKKRNENWEEYSSRVAFYALLGYFRDSTDASGLDQWMRIVWNIIENSTIDSEDTYQSALRLIEELVAKSPKEEKAPARDILKWLACPQNQNMILSGFAKDQLHEELLKAKKLQEELVMLGEKSITQDNDGDSISWQKMIYKAEALPCLRGKIQILFQDDEATTIGKFKDRLDLLERILKTSESNPYHLQKVLLSNYDQECPMVEMDLSNAEGARKKLLTRTLSDCFQKVMSDTIRRSSHAWINDLTLTELLNKRNVDRKNVVSRYGTRVVLWGKTAGYWYSFGNPIKETIILGINRSLLISSPEIKLENPNDKVADTKFVAGKDVNFCYNKHWFKWLGVPDKGQFDIYLLKNDWEKQGDPYARHQEESAKCGDQRTCYCFEVDAKETTESLTGKLDSLVAALQ